MGGDFVWVNVEDRLPDGPGDVVIIRRKNGNEVKAYYHADAMSWIRNYYKGNLSYFQDRKSLEFLFDVTHWRYLTKE